MAILSKGAKISMDAGHNCSPDRGASGVRVEDDLTKEVVSYLNQLFTNSGYSVKDCTPYDQSFGSVAGSLGYRVKLANEFGSAIHLCIHFNAGGGHGVECWIAGTGGLAEQYANAICANIEALGYTNRGVKVGNLYVPKYTNAPCVLVEGGFVDSADDMARYNGQAIAQAIFKAVTGVDVPANVPAKPVNPAPVVPVSNNAIADGVYHVTSLPYSLNAQVQNDWFYVRDSHGNAVPGRQVSIGDKIIVLDISYSTQLVEVIYPTGEGYVHGYIKNVPANIKYFYQDAWKNGGSLENVFNNSDLTGDIGDIGPGEHATPLYRKNGHLHLAYNAGQGGLRNKSGYVLYDGKDEGHFTKF